MFFFFKQKWAYDLRLRDWSSDVCSSDLLEHDVAMACEQFCKSIAGCCWSHGLGEVHSGRMVGGLRHDSRWWMIRHATMMFCAYRVVAHLLKLPDLPIDRKCVV